MSEISPKLPRIPTVEADVPGNSGAEAVPDAVASATENVSTLRVVLPPGALITADGIVEGRPGAGPDSLDTAAQNTVEPVIE